MIFVCISPWIWLSVAPKKNSKKLYEDIRNELELSRILELFFMHIFVFACFLKIIQIPHFFCVLAYASRSTKKNFEKTL